jgi:hypothetical protein
MARINGIDGGGDTAPLVPWSQAGVETGFGEWSCIYNGGVYKNNDWNGDSNSDASNTCIAYGAQAPYSIYGHIETLQAGTTGTFEHSSSYEDVDGTTWTIPAMKASVGPVSTMPLRLVRLPHATTSVAGIGGSNTANTNVFQPTPSQIERNLTPVNANQFSLNGHGEAICVWVNALSPGVQTSETTNQKLLMDFMLETTISFDLPINYNFIAVENPTTSPMRIAGQQGKTVALPYQECGFATPFWYCGDALHKAHNNLA